MTAMFRFTAALVAVLCVLGVARSDVDPHGNDLYLTGEASEDVIHEFAARRGLAGPGRESAQTDPHLPTFIFGERVTLTQAVAMLSEASGLDLSVDTRRGILRAGDADQPGRHRVPKVYDVSILCNRHVAYVNRYGRVADEDADFKGTMASEYLCESIEALMEHVTRKRVQPLAVADKLMVTVPGYVHEPVGELLDLLKSDNGGESADLKADRAIFRKLRVAASALRMDDSSVGAILIELCRAAGVNTVVSNDFATDVQERSTTFYTLDGETTEAAISRLMLENDMDEYSLSVRHGVLVIEPIDERTGGFRVFEAGALLERVATAIERQRTQPGREEGFTGSIRDRGGIMTILRALEGELYELGLYAPIYHVGTKIVVCGGAEVADAVEELLGQLGLDAGDNNAGE
jgi:hypothetical protein